MQHLRITNTHNGKLLGGRIAHADSFWLRLRGLLGRPAPMKGEGMLITPCRAVHTYWMKYPIDVVFVDDAGVVLDSCPELEPGQRSARIRKAKHVLELPAGTLQETGTGPGDLLSIEPVIRGGARPGATAEPSGRLRERVRS